ncbi:MAG: V-type ATP synthase subunit E [Candidatus Krumholzibacteria bacterium]|nr:V-type ATP synthase subunit E [Candidatus Krumholzibacteria bacterium]
MSIENILKRIEEETQAAEAEVLRAAGIRAASVREEGERGGAKLREELQSRVRAKASDEERRLVVGEELELRKASLERKREILGEVYAEARKRIENLPPGEYLKLMSAFILKSAISGNEEIVVPAAQRSMFAGDFVESLNRARGAGAAFAVAEAPGDFAWWVVLIEGQRRVDLTLGVIFRQLTARVESAVAGVLFPD